MGNLLKLKDANPKARPLFDKLILFAQSKGFDVIVTGCYYDYAKGVELHKVDSRNPLWSYHTFALAIDINLVNQTTGERLMKASKSALWEATGVPSYARSIGLRWGGNFASYYDPIHFDLPCLSIDQLRSLATNQGLTDKYNTLKIS